MCVNSFVRVIFSERLSRRAARIRQWAILSSRTFVEHAIFSAILTVYPVSMARAKFLDEHPRSLTDISQFIICVILLFSVSLNDLVSIFHGLEKGFHACFWVYWLLMLSLMWRNVTDLLYAFNRHSPLIQCEWSTSTIFFFLQTKKGVKRKADTTTPCSANALPASPFGITPSATELLNDSRRDAMRPSKRPKKESAEDLSEPLSEQWKYCLGIVKDLMSKKCKVSCKFVVMMW